MRSVSTVSGVKDKVGNFIRSNFLVTFVTIFSLTLAMPAAAVIVNVGGGIPTGMEIEDTPDGLANKTTEDADTDGTGVSFDWNDILNGPVPGPYEHDQMLEVIPGDPGSLTDFTFKSLGVVQSVFNTDATENGEGCVGGNEDGFGANTKLNTNPYIPISVDPNGKTDACSGGAAVEVVTQINNDTGDEQNHFILYNYWTRTFGATGSMIAFQLLRGPTQYNPDTPGATLGDPEYRCDDFLLKFDMEPNTNSVVVSSLTWKPNGTGAPPYTNAECAGPGVWQLYDSDFDGDPGPDTGGGVGNFGPNVDPVDTGQVPNSEEGTFGESGVDLTALGVLPEDGPCSVFTNQGFITSTGNSTNPGLSDIMAFDEPLIITNCTDIEISKTGNTASTENFTYILDQADGLAVHDNVGSLVEVNGLGVDTDGVETSITSLINIGDTHYWENILSEPDYLLDETAMPAGWEIGTVVCTYWDAFGLDTRIDQILPEQNDGPWDQAGGVDDPDTFEVPPNQVNNGIITSCVVSNITSGLVVEKIITQGNTGLATLDDFNVLVDGVEVAWTTPLSTTSGIEQVTAFAGIYTLSEDDLGSYTEGTWSCVDGLGAEVTVTNSGAFGGADVEVEAGQIVTCSITNESLASLTVVKNTAPGSNGIFDFSGNNSIGNFQLDTGVSNVDQTTFNNLLPGVDYSITEVIPADWDLATASCNTTSDDLSITGSEGLIAGIELAIGQAVTCTFNNIPSGASSFSKTSIGGLGSFDFTSNLPNLPSGNGSFSLTTSGDATGGTSPPLAGSGLVADTLYTIIETLKPGWTLTAIECTQSGIQNWSPDIPNRTLAFTALSGETINCDFTNTKDGTVIIEKQTIPNGDSASFEFTGNLAGDLMDGEQLSASDNFVAPASSVETVPTGWELTDITCSGGTESSVVSIGTGDTSMFETGDVLVSVQPAPGEIVTCVYTNTKQGSITVIKEITATGPAIQDFSFTSNLPGSAAFDLSPVDELTSDALTLSNLTQGIYSVSETNPTPAGWVLISSSCEDESPVGAIDLAPGEDLICTFVNAPLGSASIVKTTVGGDGGPFEFTWGNNTNTNVPEGEADTFTLTTPGATASRDFTNKLQINEPYDIAETDSPTAVGPYLQSWNLTGTNCVDLIGDDTTVPGANGADATIVSDSNETVACTFTNTLDGTLVIRKQTLPDGDTTNFAFTGTEAGLTGSLQDYENALAELSHTGQPGVYESAETVPAGWVLTDISCTNAINSTVTYDGSDSFVPNTGGTSVEVNLAAGETVVCTFTNTKDGSLTIIKDAVGGDGQFSFSHDVPENGVVVSPTIINTAIDDTAVLSTTLQPGEYLVTEAVPTGWELTNIICTDAFDSTITIGGAGAFEPGDESVTVEMLSGEDIVCTFTNTKQATLIVRKLTDPDTSTQGFSFTGDVSGGPIVNAGTLMTENLSPGTYSSTETAVAGWDLTDITCDDVESLNPSTGDTGTGVATFNAEAGEVVTCTFTNTIQRAQIIVNKVTDPIGSTQPFDFTMTGTNVDLAFQLADATTPYNSGDLLPTSENGTYNVAETLPTGWTQSSATCDDDSDPAAIDLAPGEIVTCTFTNTITSGKIVVDKVTSPAGSTQSFDFVTNYGANGFSLTDTAQANDSGDLLPSSEAGVYTVSENDTAGWVQTSAVCTGDGNTPEAITVLPGETVICTFTNTIQAGQIIVDKQTAPAASPVLFDFTLTGTNVDQAFQLADETNSYNSGDLLPMSENGAYNVGETLPEGWSSVSAACSDGSDPTAVDLSPAEIVTCTFVNALAGQSTFTKLTIGGDDTFIFSSQTPALNFSLTTVDGTSETLSSGMLEAGSYTLTEEALDGWELTDIVCTESDIQDSVVDIPTRTITLNVQDGESINCSVTNTKLGSITVSKATVPIGNATLFAFSGDVAGSIADGEAITVSDLSAGAYTSVEAAAAGWDLTDISCDDGASTTPSTGDIATRTATFNLDAGEDVICTFTNLLPSPVLDVLPVPVNDKLALLLLTLMMLASGWYFRPVTIRKL